MNISPKLDIIGYIKIDEDKPERIKNLMICIRGYTLLKRESRFILKLHTPSEWLYALVDRELQQAGWDYLLYRTTASDKVDYGKEYLLLLKQSKAKYILNFIEDHFLMMSEDDMRATLICMDKLSVDVLRSSFRHVELVSVAGVSDKIELSHGFVFKANAHNYDQFKHKWHRYFIGVNFITTHKFANKFWDRNDVFTRPHEYEITSYDIQWEHWCMVPKGEVLCSIDDDHGIAHSCLQHRKDADSFELSWYREIIKGIKPIDYFKLHDPIKLFHINDYEIKTEKLGNHLHGSIVREFERNFCDYVGAKYGCSLNSATNAIYMVMDCPRSFMEIVEVPSMIPPVVINALINARQEIMFADNWGWIGRDYELYEDGEIRIVDSAQRVSRNQYALESIKESDIMIFSHYPTKPVGSCDGAMVVSNDKDFIENLRMLSMNGMSQEENNWERTQKAVGHKMYMNSIQAYMANENLKTLDKRKVRLNDIRAKYNDAFELENTSDHLYRIMVKNRSEFMEAMKVDSIVCGIHYAAQHLNPLFSHIMCPADMLITEKISETTVSIPFNHELTNDQIEYVIGAVSRHTN
jgi:dTDP-4-amino-4,6-dideoxygalactose transaminase